jgi:hypothetical protein
MVAIVSLSSAQVAPRFNRVLDFAEEQEKKLAYVGI